MQDLISRRERLIEQLDGAARARFDRLEGRHPIVKGAVATLQLLYALIIVIILGVGFASLLLFGQAHPSLGIIQPVWDWLFAEKAGIVSLVTPVGVAAFSVGTFGLILTRAIKVWQSPSRVERLEMEQRRSELGGVRWVLWVGVFKVLAGMPLVTLLASLADLLGGFSVASLLLKSWYRWAMTASKAVVQLVLSILQSPMGGGLYILGGIGMFIRNPFSSEGTLEKELSKVEIRLNIDVEDAFYKRLPRSFYLRGVNAVVWGCVVVCGVVALAVFTGVVPPNPNPFVQGTIVPVLAALFGICFGQIIAWVANLLIWWSTVSWPTREDDWVACQRLAVGTMVWALPGALSGLVSVLAAFVSRASVVASTQAFGTACQQLYGALTSQIVAWIRARETSTN